MNWQDWISENRLPPSLFPDTLFESEWTPGPADTKAAWILYTEMRTRIATQPLHFRAGEEKSALTSLYQLFELTRKSIRDHGPECRCYAILATTMLNGVIRPFTAKWHKRSEDGDLDAEDVRHEFRVELSRLQISLRSFQTMFGRLAEGDRFVPGTETAWNVQAIREEEAAIRKEQERASALDAARSDAWWPTAVQDQRAFLLGDTAGGLAEKGGEIDRCIQARIDFPSEVAEVTADEIRRYEHDEIRRRRSTLEMNEVGETGGKSADTRELHNLVGLAISGGGIRSSSFSLGVLQRLSQQGLLREVDYLSTVSGGGYTGAFLSSYLNSKDATARTPYIALAPAALPFRCPDDAESRALRWIRNRSSYLLFGDWTRKLQIVGSAVFGVLVNLFATSPLAVGAACLTKLLLGSWFAGIVNGARPSFPLAGWPGDLWRYAWLFSGLLALGLAPVLTFSSCCGFVRWFGNGYRRVCLCLIPIIILVTVVNLVPLISFAIHDMAIRDPAAAGVDASWWRQPIVAVGLSVLLPLLTAAVSLLTKRRKAFDWLAIAAFALSGPLFFAVLYFALLEWFVVRPPLDEASWILSVSWWWLLALLMIPLAYGLLLMNVNLTGPHRMYCESLSRTFLVRADETNRQNVREADPQKLSDLRTNNPAAPYHLINTALNVPASDEPELRGRQSDFFLLSQGYCGSVLSGYASTREVESLDPHMNLGTAMAISGAAAAPYMGTTTRRSASSLMTLLNVRLGYWMANPWNKPSGPVARWFRRQLSANALCLVKELFGWFDHKGGRVNLSDGGHIENLGVYELLRRRCKFIIAIDGEQDERLNCGSLMKLIRYAKIDLNAEIEPIGLDDLRLNEQGLSKSHFALAVIRYQPTGSRSANACLADPNQDIGVLLYLKSSLTGNESVPLAEYRLRHRVFPHHSTLDQFFDEEQFESYRALGYHVASEALRDEFFKGKAPPTTLTISAWFRHLARNLLAE